MSSYVLITRPKNDAQDLATAVEALGFIPFIEPLLRIEPLAVTLPPLEGFQALVFTSANGARVFAGMTENRRHPVYCTGDFTAEVARTLGWRTAYSADGDAGDLMLLLSEAGLDPARPLLHPGGRDVARTIEVPGLGVEHLAIDEAVQERVLSDDVLDLLDRGQIAAALFFSARTARTCAALLEKYGRTAAAKSIKTLCLSDSVVKSLRHLSWRDVQVAKTPDRAGMLALLAQCAPSVKDVKS